MLSEERFAEEIGHCLNSIDKVNYIMNEADNITYDAMDYVIHSHKNASTYLVKASHYYSTMSRVFKKNHASIISEVSQVYRKVSRGLVIWFLHREDLPIEATIFIIDGILNLEDIDTGFEGIFEFECNADIYRDITMEYDLIFRLSEMTDKDILQNAFERVPNLIDKIEKLNQNIADRNYTTAERNFIIDSLVSIENSVLRLKRRLEID